MFLFLWPTRVHIPNGRPTSIGSPGCGAVLLRDRLIYSCLPGPQQQTGRSGMQRSIDETAKGTDGRTSYRYIDPTEYHASSVESWIENGTTSYSIVTYLVQVVRDVKYERHKVGLLDMNVA